MKHKNLLLLFTLIFWGSSSSLGQLPTPDNDIFVTNEVSINTNQLEFSPAFFENGILFISTNPAGKKFKVTDTRIDKNIMSIFRSIRNEEGTLQAPKPFAIELLSTVHEGPLTFDRTAENMYFTRNNRKGKKLIKAKDGIVKLQIYSSQRLDNVWKNVEKLSFNDRHSNAAHPSISVENDQLFFCSDRPGGLGGMDLYVSIKTAEGWGEPINLGPKVNTEKDEVFPFIHADGTLYFSSNGHAGMGDLDIFTTKKANGEWVIPENMSAPFNSPKDDFGIIIDRDKKNGYFSSSRNGGIGQDDIYSFYALNGLEKNEEEVDDFEKEITIIVKDEETGSIVEEAIVTYMKLDETSLSRAITSLPGSKNKDTNPQDLVLKLPIDENAKTGFTDNLGQIPILLKRGNYVLKVEKTSYYPIQLAINSESDPTEYVVSLTKFDETLANGNGNPNNPGSGVDSTNSTDPFVDGGIVTKIEEGTVIELTNIYYNFNDASIRPDAQVDLNGLADFLTKYPNTEIELLSHTDARGSDRYNNRLSQRRAEEAVAYLVKKGVRPYQVTPRGYGETALRNQCNDFTVCTEAEHQYNRRTEIKIIKMDVPITVKFINNDPAYISKAPPSIRNATKQSTPVESDPTGISVTSALGDPAYDPEGMYKVIAGAFANISNAERRLVQVRDLGYNNADILKFGDQGLFHVVVSRYSDNNEAFKTVRKLKSKDFKSYVKN